MINTSHVKIGLGSLMSGLVVVSLLAGCGGGTTITAIKTETKTVSGGTIAPATVTVATTVTSAGSGSGSVMGNVVVYGDIVCNIGCLQTSTGHRGELIVFRQRVVDPKTGKDLVKEDMKSVTITLPDKSIAPIVCTYGKHGTDPDSDYFWAGIWEVPLNYPTGSLGYQADVVANDGRTGSWKPFGLLTSRLTIVPFDVNFVRNWTANLTATGFSVATVTMAAGAKITFTNKDTIPHSITGADWQSGAIAAAGTYVKAFSTPGTYQVKDGSFILTVVVNAIVA